MRLFPYDTSGYQYRGGRMGNLRQTLVCCLGITSVLLLGMASRAEAVVPFCTFGTLPGQCKEPGGVAVDRSLGRVYVVDRGNDRVNVFEENGSLLFSFGTSG